MDERENNDELWQDIRYFMEKLAKMGFGNINHPSNSCPDIPYHFTQQELDIRERRDTVINGDDIHNLKISLGLYESNKITFEEMLNSI
ncbi:MAG: hypothetical protein WC260_01445 [Candidatus Pacearchaeota archaeon]